MAKNKIIGSVILILALALSVFLLLIIPSEYTSAVWITLIFNVIAFLSQLILWLMMFKKDEGKEGVFYKTPVMTASTIYMVIQFIICLIVGFTGTSMSSKVAIIVNFVLFILMWVLILSLISAKDYAKEADSRQKDHHVRL